MSDIRFGTDGWRGRIADDFTFRNVRRVADAVASFILDTHGRRHPVPIGYDRRFFSREFALESARVMKHRGLTVRLAAGPVTSPSVSVWLATQQWPIGVMITASHNPADYNGFKLKEGKGRSAPPEVTRAVESRVQDAPPAGPCPALEPQDHGDWRSEYERYLSSQLDWKALRTFSGTIVFDAMHGVGAGVLQRILKRAPRLRVIALHDAHDPLFGGLHPEPIEPWLGELQKTVCAQRARIGIAVDGDADRLGIVDDRGVYLTPHQVFPLLAWYGLESKRWAGRLVQSISLGALGPRIARAYQRDFVEVPVGFKHIAEEMLSGPVAAGGEESGGYAFAGGLPERDGILCGLRVLEMLAVTGKPLSILVSDMERRFGAARFDRIDVLLKAPIWDKQAFVQKVQARLPAKIGSHAVREVRTFDGVKIIRSDDSWVLLRPSGTEPLLRTYAESSSWSETRQLLKWAQQMVQSF